MTRKSFFSVLVLIAALAPLGAPHLSLSQSSQREGYLRQTSVELTPRGSDGQVVPLSRADLYVDVWGRGQLVRLPRNGQTAVLRLDREWLCNAWADRL